MNQERHDIQDDLEQDAFVEGILRAWNTVSRHSTLTVSVILLVLAGIFATRWVMTQRQADHDNAQVLLARGVSHFDNQNYGEAGEWFHRTQEEYSGSDAAMDAQYFMGMIALREERFSEASSELEHYLHGRHRGDFMEASAIAGLAVCAEHESNWEEAARQWTKAALMEDANFRASTHLLNAALCWERSGNVEEGLRLLDRLLEKHSTSQEKTRAEVVRERMLRMQ